MLPVALAAPLREALLTADFTYDTISELLGEQAHQALSRNETTPGLRRTTSGEPLATLVRLFLLQAAVPTDAAERALPGLVDRLATAGVLNQSVGEVAARREAPGGRDGDVGRGGIVHARTQPAAHAADQRVHLPHRRRRNSWPSPGVGLGRSVTEWLP